MAQKRKSFDDTAKGSKPQGSSGGDKSNMIKLAVVAVALVGAGVGMAYYYGAFDSPPPPPTPIEQTLDEQGLKELEDMKRVQERLERIHKAPAGS